jgi:4-amino-4-deoxy-L-arabinose transferase-like glycosyltransferase
VKYFLYLVVIVMVAACLRFFQLGTHSLWLDEIWQAVVTSEPWMKMIRLVSVDVHPPLDMISEKIAVGLFGHSDFVVRLPACLYGTITVILVWLFVRKILSEESALLTSALVAFSPLAIAYSQEARMYSLFFMLSVGLTYTSVRFLEKPNIYKAIALGLAGGLLLLTQYFSIFIIAFYFSATGILLFFSPSQNKSKNILLLGLGALLAMLIFLPWLPILLKQMHGMGNDAGAPFQPNLNFFKFILNGFSVNTGGGEGPWFYSFLLFFLAGLGLAIYKGKKAVIFMGTFFIGIVLFFWGLSFFKEVVALRRIIFLLPFFLTVIAYAIESLLPGKFKYSLECGLIGIVLFMTVPIYHYHFDGRPDFKPNWKMAAKYIAQHSNSDERVIATEIYSRTCLGYYLEPQASYIITRPDFKDQTNNISAKIWVLNDDLLKKIQNHQWEGWFVLSPFMVGVSDPEQEYKRLSLMLPKSEIEFATQGHGHSLAVYYCKKKL